MTVQTGDLVGNTSYATVPCSLVLEDGAAGDDDNKLRFESFPDQIEEAYALNAYREIAGDRMPQPGEVSYRGGNWSAFAIELKFRASLTPGDTGKTISQLSVNDMQEVLRSMERKVRWCQALAFPMPRTARGVIDRVERLASLYGQGRINGSLLSAAGLKLLGKFTRSDPPVVFVVFGSFLTMRCYLTNYSLRWEAPFHPVTAQPYGCTVTLTFQRLDKVLPTWKSIRNSPGKTQQAPFLPRVVGNVNVRADARRTAAGQREADNARVQADARNSSAVLNTWGALTNG